MRIRVLPLNLLVNTNMSRDAYGDNRFIRANVLDNSDAF